MPVQRLRGERLQIMLATEELVLVDDFRFKRRMPSRAAAVRELFRRGLAAEKQAHLDEAFGYYKQAYTLSPHDGKYFAAFTRMRFDAAFCSVHAPGLNWVELSERLQSRVGGFVLLSDHHDPELSADFDGDGRFVVAKPVQESDLERVLRSLDSLVESQNPR